ncbi:hypothetical protein QBC41DRAFT_356921 [Cercophora samala]|uniref:Uncharacterized protein n=1 Tax=Cercophora samala TaxID=330535 RepID=A0AA39ZBU0_9PEZI|nr:hypothetical protein QBC41DRAFT_356921 [Cercophora samala]
MRTLLALTLLGARVAGQNGQNGVWFIYPTEGHTYQHMDTVNVTYESPFPTPTLFGWCDGGSTNFYDQRAPGYNASIAVLLNFTSGTPCWFNLRPGRVAGYGANSPQFNLLGVERASGGIVHGPKPFKSKSAPPQSLTTSSISTTAVSTASQVHASSEQHEPTSATTPNSPQADEKYRGDGGGLGGGQSAAIVIGAIVGVLILTAGLFFWWKKRARRVGRQSQHHEAAHPNYCQHHPGQPQWQHQAGTESLWSGNPATYVHSRVHDGPCTCVCPTHGQAQVKGWPVEVSSTNSPSEISTSDPAWAARLKYEMPA